MNKSRFCLIKKKRGFGGDRAPPMSRGGWGEWADAGPLIAPETRDLADVCRSCVRRRSSRCAAAAGDGRLVCVWPVWWGCRPPPQGPSEAPPGESPRPGRYVQQQAAFALWGPAKTREKSELNVESLSPPTPSPTPPKKKPKCGYIRAAFKYRNFYNERIFTGKFL